MSNNFLISHPYLSFAIATFGLGAIQSIIIYYIMIKDNEKRHLELLRVINYLDDEISSTKREIIQLNKQLFKYKKNVTFFDDLNENSSKKYTCSSSSSIISDALYLDVSENFKDFTIDHSTFTNEDILQKIHDTFSFDFSTIDQQLENNENLAAYNALKTLYDESTENKNNIELLWRLCRACYQRGFEFAAKDSKRKEFMFEGKKYGEEAVKIDNSNFDVLKWAAACIGQSTNFMGTKEKIETGYFFKELLDKALVMDDSEYTLLYMRGRFCYSVASLSWIERKAASAFYATPPTATYEDALTDFLKVEEIKKGEWLENLLFIGRCYYQINDKSSSLKYLKMAVECPNNKGEAEKDMLVEVQALMKKCSK